MLNFNPFKVRDTNHKFHLSLIYDKLVLILKTELGWDTRIDNNEFFTEMNINEDASRISKCLSDLRLRSLDDMLVLFKGVPISLLDDKGRKSGDIFYGISDTTISILRVISDNLCRIAKEDPDNTTIRYQIQRYGWNAFIAPCFLRSCGFKYVDAIRLIHLLDRVGIETVDRLSCLVDVNDMPTIIPISGLETKCGIHNSSTMIPISDLETKCGMHVNEVAHFHMIVHTLKYYKTERHYWDADLNFSELSKKRDAHRDAHIKDPVNTVP